MVMDHLSISELSEKRLRELHLYKELMSADERRDRYQLLRLSGAVPGQASRWRDWSPNHYQMMLEYVLGQPEQPDQAPT